MHLKEVLLVGGQTLVLLLGLLRDNLHLLKCLQDLLQELLRRAGTSSRILILRLLLLLVLLIGPLARGPFQGQVLRSFESLKTMLMTVQGLKHLLEDIRAISGYLRGRSASRPSAG